MNVGDRVIRVRWKNALAGVVGGCWLLLALSLLAAPNLNWAQYSGLSVAAVLAVVVAVRGYRTAIVMHEGKIVLRRLAPTICLSSTDIDRVSVGEESSPIRRYFVEFHLKSGQIVRMKNVFLWGVTRTARSRVVTWVKTVDAFLAE